MNDKLNKGKITYPSEDPQHRLYYNGEIEGVMKQGFGEIIFDGEKRSDQIMKYIGEWSLDV